MTVGELKKLLGPLYALSQYRLDNWCDEARVKLLWHCGYWDGPTNGVCQLPDGQKAWFELCGDIHDAHPLYLICELTPQEIEEYESKHRDFQEMVGTHTDYYYNDSDNEGDGMPQRGGCVFSRASCDEFYKKYTVTLTREQIQEMAEDHNQRNVIGWFTW
jgi:hypothetical protein